MKPGGFCSRRCTAIVTRARQTPEQRSAIGRIGQAAQRDEAWERLKARLRILADTEEARWRLAYRYGQQVGRQRRHRARDAIRQQREATA